MILKSLHLYIVSDRSKLRTNVYLIHMMICRHIH